MLLFEFLALVPDASLPPATDFRRGHITAAAQREGKLLVRRGSSPVVADCAWVFNGGRSSR